MTATGSSLVSLRNVERWECQYLKRTSVGTEAGSIIVEPNKKYIPKLLELLKIENRRGKSLLHHAQLQTYSAERILDAEKLNIAESKVFREGLGICLDRPDVQESVRTLAGYMGCPTNKEMQKCLKNTKYTKPTS